MSGSFVLFRFDTISSSVICFQSQSCLSLFSTCNQDFLLIDLPFARVLSHVTYGHFFTSFSYFCSFVFLFSFVSVFPSTLRKMQKHLMFTINLLLLFVLNFICTLYFCCFHVFLLVSGTSIFSFDFNVFVQLFLICSLG